MATEYLSVSPPNDKPASMHDSARGSPEPYNDFTQLIEDINLVLGPSNGIDSDGIDVEEIKALMAGYMSSEEEWKKYAFGDHSRAYTRNLVDNCNGKSNLLVLVWSPGRASPIHDHANAHCIMKILKGSLVETLYAWPCQRSEGASDCAGAAGSRCPGTEHTCSSSGPLEPAALNIKRKTTYEPEEVTYMSDQIGLHRIQNASDSEVAVSLHLYTPPNAAKHGCHIFDESTGKSHHAKICHFFSEFGIKS